MKLLVSLIFIVYQIAVTTVLTIVGLVVTAIYALLSAVFYIGMLIFTALSKRNSNHQSDSDQE